MIGIDLKPEVVEEHRRVERRVLLGDPSDADFWDRMQATHALERVMITLPGVSATLAVIEQLRLAGFPGIIAATARCPDQEEAMMEAGADIVFDTFTEAGGGFASHVMTSTSRPAGAADRV